MLIALAIPNLVMRNSNSSRWCQVCPVASCGGAGNRSSAPRDCQSACPSSWAPWQEAHRCRHALPLWSGASRASARAPLFAQFKRRVKAPSASAHSWAKTWTEKKNGQQRPVFRACWRRGWDSNPRYLAVRLISSQVHSATLPPLLCRTGGIVAVGHARKPGAKGLLGSDPAALLAGVRLRRRVAAGLPQSHRPTRRRQRSCGAATVSTSASPSDLEAGARMYVPPV